MNEHILFAYGLDGKGGGTALAVQDIEQQLAQKHSTWVHLDANHPDTRTWVETKMADLDSSIVEALLADETRPRMSQFNDGLLLILRGVNLNTNADPEDMVSIRLWVDENRIISLWRRELKAVGDIEEKLKSGFGPKDTGEFICMLSSRLVERMEPVLTELDDNTDELEERILENAQRSLRKDVIDIRKKAIIYKRYMVPQRDAFNQLGMVSVKWLHGGHKRQLLEIYNHVIRYVEDLDAIRDHAQIAKDELSNSLADKLNKNMYVLSIISAIFLPLSFLTGLLGVNLGGIPGANHARAFWIFSGILVFIVILQIIMFIRLKWLK